MREILFRGKRADNGEWAKGDNPEIMNKKAVAIVTKDKNGKRKYQYSKGYPDELKIPND